MNKTIVAPLVGLALLGALTACNDSDGGKQDTSAAGNSSASASSSPAAPTSQAPATTTASPTAGNAPKTTPSVRPKPKNTQIVLIDPSGKKYTRKEMVRMAMLMAGAGEGKLPPNFCEVSYKQGVDGGGKFPAGKGAYMDACNEGMELGS